MTSSLVPRLFAGLVEATAARNISRTVAFELAQSGMLETFKLGNRRYVYIDSLDTLGARVTDGSEQETANHGR